MNLQHFLISIRALIHYRKEAILHFMIIAVLGAVISSSLFTGYSVRKSLERQVDIKLGRTEFLISSGLRWFSFSLGQRLASAAEFEAAAYVESDGWCRNFSTGEALLNAHIYGIDSSFFRFHHLEIDAPTADGAIINQKIATRLNLKEGDEIIISLRVTDPVPANAPFAIPEESENTRVYKVIRIIDEKNAGNFSTAISQADPFNIFISIASVQKRDDSKFLANRLIANSNNNIGRENIISALKNLIIPDDIGLNIRVSELTGETEIVSSRIFIDTLQYNLIKASLPELKPVLTYLANSIDKSDKSTPYSFVSGISLKGQFKSSNSILISKWLSEDIGAKVSDTITLKWFRQNFNNLLTEESGKFVVEGVFDQDSKLSDRSLMPDFPGISGRSTCSDWEAGIPLLLDRIREKDEEYWNLYGGTPKAFVSFETGKELWGNDFGTATALRFDSNISPDLVRQKLSGIFDPEKSGFTVSVPSVENRKASKEGVDFSTLLLSLSFFIIVSAVVLLALASSVYFESSRVRIKAFHNIGFPGNLIRNMLFAENAVIIAAGSLAGAASGYLLAHLLIHLLNNVWRGAVQTDILSAVFGIIPLLEGFFVTLIVSTLVLYIRIKKFTSLLHKGKTSSQLTRPALSPFILPLLMLVASVILMLLSLLIPNGATVLAFSSGAILFTSMILLLKDYYLGFNKKITSSNLDLKSYPRYYYMANIKAAVTPALFIAAGLFAVIITGANKMVPDEKMKLPSGGTGGYELWVETAMPVVPDPSSAEGIKEFGFEDFDDEGTVLTGAYKLSGNDASCLNINHVAAPSILGIETRNLISNNEFSFSSVLKEYSEFAPWELLNEQLSENTVFGIADQTVLQWGIKKGIGDTLKYNDESGNILNIVICGGLESSVFQGYLLIGSENFKKYFPSTGGKSVFLVHTDTAEVNETSEILTERMSRFGISAEPALERLSSFFEVTNTYLEVFTILGFIGLLLGALGMGFTILKNINSRHKELSLLLAAGVSLKRIRLMLVREQVFILLWGILSGSVPALIATWPSAGSGNFQLERIIFMTAILFITGAASIQVALSGIREERLMASLKNS